MPATSHAPAQYRLLESPALKTPGSTAIRPDRHTETRRSTRVFAPAAANLTVVQLAARQIRDLADFLTAAGRPFLLGPLPAMHQAATDATTARPELAPALAALTWRHTTEIAVLTGDHQPIRRTPCPACGVRSLTWDGRHTICLNRYCAPGAGPRRTWSLTELAAARQRPIRLRCPSREQLDTDPAADDLVLLPTAVEFLSEAGPAEYARIRSWVRQYRLPARAAVPYGGRTQPLYSLSDLMVAQAAAHQQAAHAAATTMTPARLQLLASSVKRCTPPAGSRPACTDHADLFHGPEGETPTQSAPRIRQAKRLCATCPLRKTCLEAELRLPQAEQYGVRGGLTGPERRAEIRRRRAAGDH